MGSSLSVCSYTLYRGGASFRFPLASSVKSHSLVRLPSLLIRAEFLYEPRAVGVAATSRGNSSSTTRTDGPTRSENTTEKNCLRKERTVSSAVPSAVAFARSPRIGPWGPWSVGRSPDAARCGLSRALRYERDTMCRLSVALGSTKDRRYDHRDVRCLRSVRSPPRPGSRLRSVRRGCWGRGRTAQRRPWESCKFDPGRRWE